MNRFLGVNAVLLAIVLACFGLLGAAMYMQLVLDMLPCPLCVIQRYAFLLTGVFALIALIWRSRLKAILGLGLLASLGGVGTALFGMIGVLGARIWIDNRVNFSDPTNLFIAASCLVIGISDVTWVSGDYTFNGIVLSTVLAVVGYQVLRALSKARGTSQV